MTEIDQHTDFQQGKVIFIDKSYEWSSFDVVHKIRNILRKKYGVKWIKVGHAGTLDPLATGLMIICVGPETKNISGYFDLDKEYIATLCLGKTTPSFDLETKVDHIYQTDHITIDAIEKILPQFIGPIQQIPPIFSAKRMEGKRAYDLARKGKSAELKPSKIHIHSIDILEYNRPILMLKIRCGKGTYIRALARDLGKALGSGAHLTALRRTAIGEYQVDKAMTIKKFEEKIK